MGVIALGEWLIRNLASFLLLILFTRLIIRPRLGKVGVIELFFINSIGDMAAHTVFENQHPLLAGLASMLVWIVGTALVAWLTARHPALHRLVYGEPALILREGVPDTARMKALGISMVELEAELRKQGLSSVAEASEITVETSGTLAIQKASTTAAELRDLSQALQRLADRIENRG